MKATILNRTAGHGIPVLTSLLLAACRASSPTETLPNAPVPASAGTLNMIAVGIAVAGGIVGLILALRKRDTVGAPEADTTRKPKKRKKP